MRTTAHRSVGLVKGIDRYVFWYDEGQEAELLNCLVELAEDPQTDFNWLDAAVLSYQVGRDGSREAALLPCRAAAQRNELYDGRPGEW